MSKTIVTCKIHPSIGIGRIGNSPTQFFIGPEVPGLDARPKGGYKDSEGRIKRQGARFRIFGYNAQGKVVRELTLKEAEITWTAHIANAKAAWKKFDEDRGNGPTRLRNASEKDRSSLIVDPGPRTISRAGQVAHFDTGMFLGDPVPLGEMRIEDSGRLLMLGGFGKSSSPRHKAIRTFSNNDGWHDDVSDGPIRATVRLLATGAVMQASTAWFICAPPDFAPSINGIITLYDTLKQVAIDKLGMTLPPKPSFTNDIYPILLRAINMRWVSGMVQHPKPMGQGMHPSGNMGHGGASIVKPAHLSIDHVIPPPGSDYMRKKVFKKLRDPSLAPNKASPDDSDMPMLWSDHYHHGKNQPVRPFQYDLMKQWERNHFENDWKGIPKPRRNITPDGLDRAALEACVGGPFFPGIEAGWFLRDTYEYAEPFRIDASKLRAGDVTKQLAVPWQADFNDCEEDGDLAWWPSQRPDSVFINLKDPPVLWKRGFVNSVEDMILNWHKLGYVVKKGNRYIEAERHAS
jgi:hypothetical protein